MGRLRFLPLDRATRAGGLAVCLAFAAATFMTLVAVPPVLAQQSPLAKALHRNTLPNGLEVLVVENRRVPLAMVLVAVKTGAFTQAPGEEGIAHLYEHMLFRMYKGDSRAFGRAVGDLNGYSNGWTSTEVVGYYVVVPSERTAKAIELVRDLMRGVRFTREHLDEERRVVRDELSRGASDPERAFARRVAQRLWGAAWHRRDVGGDSASLETITVERLQETFERYYVPNNAAVIVSGDVSAPEVFREVDRRFQDWARGVSLPEEVPPPPLEPLTVTRAVLSIDPDIRDVTVRIDLHGPSLEEDTASTYAADALLAILNEPSSRFQRWLMETGVFQWVGVGYETLRETGPLSFVGKTTADSAERAIGALLSALEHPEYLLDLTEEDLAAARLARELHTALAVEAGAGLALQLASWWASAGIDYYLDYGRRLNGQTSDDLRRFAERYIIGQPKVVGVLGPLPVIERVAEWLRSQARSRQ